MNKEDAYAPLIDLPGSEYRIVNYITLTEPELHEILRYQNLPEMRRWDRDSHTISWEEHLNFIKSLVGDEHRLYYAIFKEQELVGTINLHYEEEGVWSRGIGSLPSHQGKGETMKWELQILSALPKDKFKKIIADVRLDNIRSIKYHLKLGFVETGRDKEYIYYEKVL